MSFLVRVSAPLWATTDLRSIFSDNFVKILFDTAERASVPEETVRDYFFQIFLEFFYRKLEDKKKMFISFQVINFVLIYVLIIVYKPSTVLAVSFKLLLKITHIFNYHIHQS